MCMCSRAERLETLQLREAECRDRIQHVEQGMEAAGGGKQWVYTGSLFVCLDADLAARRLTQGEVCPCAVVASKTNGQGAPD